MGTERTSRDRKGAVWNTSAAALRSRLVELVIATASLLFVLPVLLIVLTAFKPESEILKLQSLIPQHPEMGARENFGHIFSNPEEVPIFRWLGNSIFISSCVTLLVLTVDSLAAYALARLRLPGGNLLFSIIVGTLGAAFAISAETSKSSIRSMAGNRCRKPLTKLLIR